MSYELAHDTLIEPILEVASKRKAKIQEIQRQKEREAEEVRKQKEEQLKQQEQERQEQLQRIERRADYERRVARIARKKLHKTQRMLAALLVALIAIGTMGWLAVDAQRTAEAERKNALKASNLAKKRQIEADSARLVAEQKAAEADSAKRRADRIAGLALLARQEAEEASEKAQSNAIYASKQKEIADSLLKIQERQARLEANKAENAIFNQRETKFKGQRTAAEALAARAKNETDTIKKAQQARTAYLIYKNALDSLSLLYKSVNKNFDSWISHEVYESLIQSYLLLSSNPVNNIDEWDSDYSSQESKYIYSSINQIPAIDRLIEIFNLLNNDSDGNDNNIQIAKIKQVQSAFTEYGITKFNSSENSFWMAIYFKDRDYQDKILVWDKQYLNKDDSGPGPILINHNQHINQLYLSPDGNSILFDDFGKINFVPLDLKYLTSDLLKELNSRQQEGIIDKQEWDEMLSDFRNLRQEILNSDKLFLN